MSALHESLCSSKIDNITSSSSRDWLSSWIFYGCIHPQEGQHLFISQRAHSFRYTHHSATTSTLEWVMERSIISSRFSFKALVWLKNYFLVYSVTVYTTSHLHHLWLQLLYPNSGSIFRSLLQRPTAERPILSSARKRLTANKAAASAGMRRQMRRQARAYGAGEQAWCCCCCCRTMHQITREKSGDMLMQLQSVQWNVIRGRHLIYINYIWSLQSWKIMHVLLIQFINNNLDLSFALYYNVDSWIQIVVC